jgi:hypothetical protein
MNETPAPTTRANAPIMTEDPHAEHGLEPQRSWAVNVHMLAGVP